MWWCVVWGTGVCVYTKTPHTRHHKLPCGMVCIPTEIQTKKADAVRVMQNVPTMYVVCAQKRIAHLLE